MGQDFRIRVATPADAPIIAWHRARMFRDMGDLTGPALEVLRARAETRLRSMLQQGEYVGWLAILAERPDEVAGGAGAQLRHVLPHPASTPDGELEVAEGRHAIVLNVYTEPAWRRHGIAEQLMRHLLAWAREERLDRLVLHASPDGRRLYERLGFVATNEMRFAAALHP
jgi:GNAT superfamily N-acetyltransferase